MPPSLAWHSRPHPVNPGGRQFGAMILGLFFRTALRPTEGTCGSTSTRPVFILNMQSR